MLISYVYTCLVKASHRVNVLKINILSQNLKMKLLTIISILKVVTCGKNPCILAKKSKSCC